MRFARSHSVLALSLTACGARAPSTAVHTPVVARRDVPSSPSPAPSSQSPAPADNDDVTKLLPPPLTLPPADVRVAMVDALRTTIERLDGDGLVYRASRPESWDGTLARLREDARVATSLPALGRVFRRIDATYPNLHSYTVTDFDLDAVQLEGRVHLPFAFAPRSVTRGARGLAFVITRVNDTVTWPRGAPHAGDEVVEINGRPMRDWVRENLVFCDFPLAEQCALELFDNLRTGLLSWERHEPLTLGLRRARETVRVAVPSGDLPHHEPALESSCAASAPRYPGFHAVYTGQHACVFESERYPGTAVLRIDSFAYRGAGEFHRVNDETEAFYTRFWNEHAASIRHLVIDVIGNHGGDAPIGYYRLLFHEPFQEQYASFRRIAEFDTPRISDEVLWENSALLLWRSALERDGTWAGTTVGSFLPPVPQFCPDEHRDCREGRFEPRPHHFAGRVSVMTDPWCVSSCAGFVWELRDVLRGRARSFGLPDSGDTSYSRLTIAITPDPTAPNGVRVSIEGMRFARDSRVVRPWIAQVVSVSRTVDSRGRVLSGIPQPIDTWVARRAGMDDDAYATAVLGEVLRR